MTNYVVLRTIRDGVLLTGQPVEGRILARTDVYGHALQVVRDNRITRYRHHPTDEARDLTQNQVVTCGYNDQDLFVWLQHATVEQVISYAVLVPADQLGQTRPPGAVPA